MRPKYRVDLRLDKKSSFGGKTNKAELQATKKAFEDEHARRIAEWKAQGERDAIAAIDLEKERDKARREQEQFVRNEEMRRINANSDRRSFDGGRTGYTCGSGIAGVSGSWQGWVDPEEEKRKEQERLYEKWVRRGGGISG